MRQTKGNGRCKNCKKKFHPNEEEFAEYVKDYGKEAFEATGITRDQSADLLLRRALGQMQELVDDGARQAQGSGHAEGSSAGFRGVDGSINFGLLLHSAVSSRPWPSKPKTLPSC